MDETVLYDLSYGLYAIGVKDNNRNCGCIVNTVFQISAEGPLIALSMNKDNYTYELIKRNKKFTISILSENSNPSVIQQLGFQSGKNQDKWNSFKFHEMEGIPVVNENCNGHLVCEVLKATQANTHYLILAKVLAADKGINAIPMTYSYYHNVIKGKAPKNAPTFRKEEVIEKAHHTCTMCGYVYDGLDFDKENDEYTCPICGAPKALFD